MKLLVQIDLSGADLVLFERYESAVLRMLADHGGTLDFRVRAVDDSTETHLLDFPSRAAFDAFVADPRRLALSKFWHASQARADRWEVKAVGADG